MIEPHTIKAIYDTRDHVVHCPDLESFAYRRDALLGLENIDEFVAWLNTKAKTHRFTVVTATPMSGSARGGMRRRYTEYLKGEPQARIRAAIKKIASARQVGLVHRGGGWEVQDATTAIRGIADDAKVTFNEARTAFLAFLRAELGEVVDRATYPPEHAVRATADDSTDEHGNVPYPVDL